MCRASTCRRSRKVNSGERKDVERANRPEEHNRFFKPDRQGITARGVIEQLIVEANPHRLRSAETCYHFEQRSFTGPDGPKIPVRAL